MSPLVPGRVAVVGSANADLVLDVERRPAAGETVLGSDVVLTPGGKGANQAAAAGRLGSRVAFIGCVGADASGEMLRASLADAGVDVAGLRAVERSTGTAIITVTPDGENSIIVSPGANREVTPGMLAEAEEHWGSAGILVAQLEIAIETVQALARHATRSGARLILNAAPMTPVPGHVLAACDPLVVNQIEAALLLEVAGGLPAGGDRDAGALAQALRQLGPRSVVLTLGAQGAVVAEASGVTRIAAPTVTAIDTTGAGDAFVGALAAALSGGQTLAQSARVAAAYAAVTVTRRGAQASYPDVAELPRLGIATGTSSDAPSSPRTGRWP